MPIIPNVTSPDVGRAALPQAQAEAPQYTDVGARQIQQTGSALGHATSQMGALQDAAIAQANRARTEDSLNGMAAFEQQLKYGNGQDGAPVGYTTLKGENALNRPNHQSLVQERAQMWDKHASTIRENLGNDAQREQFDLVNARMRAEFLGGVQRYTGQQQQAYNVGVQKGTIATYQNIATQNWGEPQQVKGATDVIRNAVRTKGQMLGQPPEEVQAETTAALSPVHVAIIGQAIDANRLDYAKQYLAANSAEMTPQARAVAEKTLDTANLTTTAQTASQELFGKHAGDPDQLAKALADARSQYTGKEQDQVVRRIKMLDHDQQAGIQQFQSNAAQQGWKLYEDHKPTPPSLYAQMNPKDAIALQKAYITPPPVHTNIGKWLEFTDMPPAQKAQMTPNELLREYRPYFSDSDLRNANKMIQAAKGMTGADAEKGLQLATASDVVTRAARELGVLPAAGTKPTTEQDGQFLAFRSQLQSKIDQWQAANGKKATPEVLEKIVNEAKMNKVYVSSFGFDQQQPVMTLSQGDRQNAYVKVGDHDVYLDRISDDYRSRAVSYLQAKGVHPTADLVAQMWLKDHPSYTVDPSWAKESAAFADRDTTGGY